MGNRIKHPSQRLTKAFLEGQKSLETDEPCPYPISNKRRAQWRAGRIDANKRLDPHFYEPPGKI